MASLRRGWLLTGVLLGSLWTTGCNLMALPYFLMPGEPKIDARCKLASADKEKEVRVVIVAANGLETRPEFLRVDFQLSRLLTQRLQEAFKQNKEKVTLIPTSRVEKY